MNDQDIEKSLSRLQVKSPDAGVRQRVLTAAHQAWAQPRGVRVPFPVIGFRWVIGYACAAALLILLNGIYSQWDSMQMAEILTPTVAEQPMDPEMKEFYTELGRDPRIFQRFSLMARPIRNSGSPVVLWKQRQEWMRSLELES
ncbi:MAG: hypothetical protein KKE37_05305 [Verrucomicrobia bacterium]|nr:hypothetical protein [Verrucomicrobiota bacterium]MBU4292181.1 hypothetical protein [Verrucomicrobiota bacterium]MBU4428755.1 hypothetical protein [Verrucomicrobiota bacterium]MCG2681625.1 hypothetical protein [Kiritimatiellia bacterium]